MKFYITSNNKILHYGKLSECAEYINTNNVNSIDYNITVYDNLNPQEKQYLEKILEEIKI